MESNFSRLPASFFPKRHYADLVMPFLFSKKAIKIKAYCTLGFFIFLKIKV